MASLLASAKFVKIVLREQVKRCYLVNMKASFVSH